MTGSDGGVDVLILAAHALELESLRAALGAEFRAELHGRTVALSEVGVGAMIAGAGAMRALLDRKPRAAILLGSCGVYPGRAAFMPGQLVIASELTAADAGVAAGRAAFPQPMPVHVEPDASLVQALRAAAEAVPGEAPLIGTLATTLAITTDDALAAQLAATGVAENLEALPVALACRIAQVPFAALLAVTNEVGSQGRAQWRQHHATAARATCDCVLRWLQRSTA